MAQKQKAGNISKKMLQRSRKISKALIISQNWGGGFEFRAGKAVNIRKAKIPEKGNADK